MREFLRRQPARTLARVTARAQHVVAERLLPFIELAAPKQPAIRRALQRDAETDRGGFESSVGLALALFPACVLARPMALQVMAILSLPK